MIITLFVNGCIFIILLKKVATIIDNQLPKNSFLARYGGEEFVMVLPNAVKADVYITAEKTRKSVEKAFIFHPMGDAGIVTFSISVATMTKEVTFESVTKLIDAADQQLYRSKRQDVIE